MLSHNKYLNRQLHQMREKAEGKNVKDVPIGHNGKDYTKILNSTHFSGTRTRVPNFRG